ncbi:OCT1 [Brettanomyces bruxellensis]|uniref:Mitochondrial intermediate peptidase n=1 Tax=Dekkera bruxellensis TaxID=5007 RepID=A0A7D9H2R6_DEKBR|nr:OCT1 [Brettanomyces bruxellensis]
MLKSGHALNKETQVVRRFSCAIKSYLGPTHTSHFRIACFYSTCQTQLEQSKHAVQIRRIFDDEQYWKKFSKSSNPQRHSILGYIGTRGKDSAGLFLNPYLKSPEGLLKFSSDSLEKAKLLTKHIIEDNSNEGLHKCVRNLDRLSDILCRVIDLCEFIRTVHPEGKFEKAAQSCHEQLYEFMNELNTSVELYKRLKQVMTDPEYTSKMLEEEYMTGKLLYFDFQISGIEFKDSVRRNFVNLSQRIEADGQAFLSGVSEPYTMHSVIPNNIIQRGDVNPSIGSGMFYDEEGNLDIPLFNNTGYLTLKTCPNRMVRRIVWRDMHSAPEQQNLRLFNLLADRYVLSIMMKKPSFNEYQLEGKMAKSPANVMTFLNNLLQEIKPGVLKELRQLYQSVQNHHIKEPTNDELIELVKPWDFEYLKWRYTQHNKDSIEEDISPYFSVGTVVSGLSSVLKSLYGIDLCPVSAQKGEIWEKDVRKFEVRNDADVLIGVIYLDLFTRPTKSTGPAHFTICCSRRVTDDEQTSSDPFNLKVQTFQTAKRDGQLYQIPIVVLECSFPGREELDAMGYDKGTPSLLDLSSVETLFHEMGHAVHSMMATTSLHSISGTRCVTDFVELPSILCEQFAKDERVLLSFARHYNTGKPLSAESLHRAKAADDNFRNLGTLGQIKMAMLDQRLHSSSINTKDYSPVKEYHDLEKEIKVYADTESSWPGKFGHLYTYGCLYYSYLLDRALALRIWEHLFAEDPLNRKSGEKLRNDILKWGGGRDPWKLIANVLDKPELSKGDLEAMQFIGRVHNF